MGNYTLTKLFPSKLSFIIFNLYIILFVNQAILVKASQNTSNSYDYSTICVVLLTEVLKLILSTLLYVREGSFSALWKDVICNKGLLALYLVPAFLYCVYNNLAFHNLAAFDPTTYYLLLQFRVVITAVVYQIIFSKKLSRKQWFALILLTFGCILKQLDSTQSASFQFSAHFGTLMLVLLQTCCSCFAGVYNEYLLKGDGASVNIYVQNVFMYLDSIVCNLAVMLYQNEFTEIFSSDSLAKVFYRPIVVCIMVNSAAIGIVTSFFLKTLDSILKVFASGLDLVITAVMCLLLFGIPIHFGTALSIGVVLAAIWIYSQNPVKKEPEHFAKEEKEELLMEEVLVEKDHTNV